MQDARAELARIDREEFAREISALGEATIKQIGPTDLAHLRKIERIGRACTILGLATAWVFPNPLTVALLAMGLGTRWLLMHHIGHGGYDRVPGIPSRYTSRGFAKGYRRYIDWFDWMLPAGWKHEHNVLHHFHTGEECDPDLVERNIEELRNSRAPRLFKYVFLFFAAITWKFTYYAPNTLNALEAKRRKKDPRRRVRNITRWNFLNLMNPLVLELWFRCYLPYVTVHFVLLPALFLPLGTTAALFVLINRLLAEFVHNFHGLMVIAPNHAGDDLYRFDFHYKDRAEFYITQVIGSVNYRCGTGWLDYSQLWLNYQIEHHLFPYLPMLKYREIQPRVKAICERHGVPYVQESVWIRFGKFIGICVGARTMPRLQELASDAEPLAEVA